MPDLTRQKNSEKASGQLELSGKARGPKESTMIVGFCDLKGSTQVLREVGAKWFRKIQEEFFSQSSGVVHAANEERHGKSEPCSPDQLTPAIDAAIPKPWVRIDKFMGDCVMFYVNCGGKKQDPSKSGKISEEDHLKTLAEGALITMRVLLGMIEVIDQVSKWKELVSHQIRLGSRIGIAMGHDVLLSHLGEREKPGFSYTLTGETVNLAARLEHASRADFLQCIGEARGQLKAYTEHISSPERLHGTALSERLLEVDKYVLDLFVVCERRFQIRANDLFVEQLGRVDRFGLGKEPIRLRWRRLPFTPQGFSSDQMINVLGGDTVQELFRTV